jgi:hypothetical protein
MLNGAVVIAVIHFSIRPEFVEQTEAALQIEAKSLIQTPIIFINLDERLKAETLEMGYLNVNGPALIRIPD